jgi:hypothetical protein
MTESKCLVDLQKQDPCEDCEDKMTWYCKTCCPISIYQEEDDENGDEEYDQC